MASKSKSTSKKKPVYTHGITFNEPSLTEQHHRSEIDTNVLVKRWMKTGIPPTAIKQNGWYGVVPAIDYQTAQNTMMSAVRTFDELPARVRAQFDNKIEEFLRFAGDDENETELLNLLGPQPEDYGIDPESEGSIEESTEENDPSNQPGTEPPLDVTVPNDTE